MRRYVQMDLNNTIDVLHRPICYSEFYESYLKANKPVLLAESFTQSWPCRKLWVKNGEPNWTYLKNNYGKIVEISW